AKSRHAEQSAQTGGAGAENIPREGGHHRSISAEKVDAGVHAHQSQNRRILANEIEATSHALEGRFGFFRGRTRPRAHEGEANNYAEETQGIDEIRDTDTERANNDPTQEGTCQRRDLPPGYIQSVGGGQLFAGNQQRYQRRSCGNIKNANRSG